MARSPFRLPRDDSWRRYLKPIPLNTRDVGKLLRSYLQSNEPSLVRPLYSTWNAQRDALKYQEIRNALRDGELSTEVLEQWRQSYSTLVNEKFHPAWRKAVTHGGTATAKWLESLRLNWDFPAMTDRVEKWIESRGGELIVRLSEQQQTAARNVIRRMVVDQGSGVDELAKVLRPVVGLTPRDANAVMKMREDLLARGVEKRVVDHQTGNYSGYLHRRRAQTIARTEIASAINEGHIQGFVQAQEDGVLTKPVQKVWHTAEDEFVCERCGPMNDQSVSLADSFSTPDGPLDRPPMHPNCRCDVLFTVILD
jgi:hypothetical protein